MDELTIFKKHFYCPKDVKLIKGKTLSINNNVITYTDIPSLGFLLTYYQSFKDTKLNKTFKRNFNSNGLLIDASRNGVAKVETIKDFILKSVQLGFNRFYLYIEDTYKIKGEPFFGYLRGAYSESELKEIAKFANMFGVEIIPCIQTLSHLKQTLRHREYENIRDGSSTLLIGETATYQLIEKMIKTVTDVFHPSIVHVGMDEAFEFGRNQYLDKHGAVDRVKLFNEHLNKVIKIGKKYNVKTYIWGDMYFRILFNSEYKISNELPDYVLKSIPKDVSLIYWDYYRNSEEEYSAAIKSYLLTKRHIVFAGGSWRWLGFAPAIRESIKKTDSALRACVKHNIKDIFACAWGDNGNECSYYTALPVMCQYALYDYCSKSSEDDINRLLLTLSGDKLEYFLSLDLPNQEDNKVNHISAHNPSKYYFYQDPMNGIFDRYVKPSYADNYLNHSITLLSISKKSKSYSYIYENLANLCKFLSIKTTLGTRLHNSYKRKDKKELKKISDVDIPNALTYLDTFHKSLRAQWMKENKPFGFDVLDGRIGYLTNRLKDTIVTLKEYLNGTIKKIELLEEPILLYDNRSTDEDICWNCWTQNITVNNL